MVDTRIDELAARLGKKLPPIVEAPIDNLADIDKISPSQKMREDKPSGKMVYMIPPELNLPTISSDRNPEVEWGPNLVPAGAHPYVRPTTQDTPAQSRPRGVRETLLSTPTGMKAQLDKMTVPKLPYRTFSGCDINCILHVIGNDGITEPVIIANVQTLSYSVHREKFPVRCLGRTYASGYTRGARTIAGTLVFTMFDREVLWELLQGYKMDMDPTDDTYTAALKTPLLDQLPPFDITVEFSNEYGHRAFMAIYGVELQDEGAVMSIDDMIVEKTVQYVARDIDILRPNDIEDIGTYNMVDSSGVSTDDYNKFVEELSKRRKLIEGGENDDVYGYDIPYDSVIFSAGVNTTNAANRVVANSPVIYRSMGSDQRGDLIVWSGKAIVVRGNDAMFVPDEQIYSKTGDGEWYIYDTVFNFLDSAIPPHLKMSVSGTKVPVSELMPREGWVY